GLVQRGHHPRWLTGRLSTRAIRMPGNPEGLAGLVSCLRREAADIRSAVDRLSAVNSEEFWEGDAATAFAEGRGRAVPDLEMVGHRIETSANALAGFVPAMGDCQTRGK